MRRWMLILLIGLGFSACHPSDRELVERADVEAVNQRSQLAKYLYLQVLQNHSQRDEIRFKALKGFAEISMDELFDYPTAVGAIEKLIDEYQSEPFFKNEVVQWRFKAARLYRLHLQRIDKAHQVLNPISNRDDLSFEIQRELGEIALAEGRHTEAESFFKLAFENAKSSGRCELMKEAQMSLIQNYTLMKKCDQAIQWMDSKLPKDCNPNYFAMQFERAHCHEIMGEAPKAIAVYEDLLIKNPRNARAHFMLEGIKKRQREKAYR